MRDADVRAQDQLLEVAASAGRVVARKSRSQSVGPRDDDDVRLVQRETDSGWRRSLRFIQLELPVNRITVHALRQA